MQTDRLRVPGDKSITHRALIIGALATGRSRILRPLRGADTLSSAGAMRMLGAQVHDAEDECFIVEGAGLHGLRAPGGAIDCGNSGTTVRLLMGVLAGYSFEALLTGDDSLRSRPMRRVTTPLTLMGASFEERGEPDRLPIVVRGGALRPLDYDSPQASAQVKSAILLAGLCGSADVTVTEPLPSRDHTERMLGHMGVRLQRRLHDDGRATVTLSPVPQLDAFEIEVPGDISSAAFIIAWALLAARRPVRIEAVGLNPLRTGFLDVVRRMGGNVTIENARESCGEPIGDIVVERSDLSGVSVTAAEMPSLIDEVPVLAVLAACAEGRTVIEGAGELRVKESDRIRVMVDNLRTVGANAEERPDGMVIHGGAARFAGATHATGDHRIAMSFGVLGSVTGGAVTVDDRAVVDVSFPGFWRLLEELSA